MSIKDCLKKIPTSEADSTFLLKRFASYEREAKDPVAASNLALNDLYKHLHGEWNAVKAAVGLPIDKYVSPMLRVKKLEREAAVRKAAEKKDAPLKSVAAESQVDTPEFKKWFGKSVVLDSKGNPLVVYRGESSERTIFEEGGFFTDSPKDASAYAELAAMRQAIDENEELSEVVSEILAEEGGEDITDLGPDTIRDIAEGNGFDLGENGDGHITAAYLKMENPLDLTDFGSDVGTVSDLWDNLHAQGLLDEKWSDLDEDAQYEIEEDYRDKALYKFLENEDIQAKAFKQGFDGVIFEDMSLEGKKTHTTWLVKEPNQIKSATNNRGTFDPNEASILKSVDDDAKPLHDKLRYASNTADVLPYVEGGKVNENGEVELSVGDAEIIRRLLAEQYFQRHGTEIDEKAFDGFVWNRASLAGIARFGDKKGRTMLLDSGITPEQLSGYDKLLKTLTDAANSEKTHKQDEAIVAYVFDSALPEERVHREDVNATRTDKEATDILVQSPLYKKSGTLFNRQHPNISEADKISEIAAKLATNQAEKYGWNKIPGFEKHKQAFLETWAIGIVRKLENQNLIEEMGYDAWAANFPTIKAYATEAIDSQTDEGSRGDAGIGAVPQESGPDTKDAPQTEDGEAEGGKPADLEAGDEKGKLSQTPKSLRGKANIPVEDRTYVGVTNAGRQAFADEMLDKGVEGADAWFRGNAKDKNLNGGSTAVVGLNLLNYYAKNRNLKAMNEIADALVPMVTESAQTVQAMSMVSMFDPKRAAAYAAKIKKQKTGKDLTKVELEKAEQIARDLSETAATEAMLQNALNEAEALLKEFEQDIAVANEAVRIANDEKATIEVDLADAKKVISKQKAKITRLENDKPRTPKARDVKELQKNFDVTMARLVDLYGTAAMKSVIGGDNIQAAEQPIAEDIARQLIDAGYRAKIGRSNTTNSRYVRVSRNEDENPITIRVSDHRPGVLRSYPIDIRVGEDVSNIVGRVKDYYDFADKQDRDFRTKQEFARTEREAAVRKSAIGNSGAFDPSNPSILKSVSDDTTTIPDAVHDWARLTLATNWSVMSPEEFKAALGRVTNGNLTPEQIDEVHADSVDWLKRKTPSQSDAQKTAFKTRSAHFRAARSYRNNEIAKLFPKAKIDKVNNVVTAIINEGVSNGYSDEAIIFALTRKKHPSPQDAINEYKDQMGEAPSRQIMVEAVKLYGEAKTAIKDNAIQKKNDFKLTEEDVELIKKEQSLNRRASSTVNRQAAQFYSSISQTTFEQALEAIVTARKANMLTAVKTHWVNMLGNVGFGMSEQLVKAPAATIDILASAFTGQRTVTAPSATAIAHAVKNIVKQDDTLRNSTFETPEGKQSALKAMGHIWKYGGSLADLERFQHTESNVKELLGKPGAWWDGYINTVFRSLQMEDAIFKVLAFRIGLENQAKAIALTERRADRTLDIKARRAELIQNPTAFMQAKAQAEADFMTFQNDNFASAFIRQLKGGRPKTKAVIETIVPYDRTPTNVVFRALEYTPLGAVPASVAAYRYFRPSEARGGDKSKFDLQYQGAIAKDMSREYSDLSETEQRKVVDELLKANYSREQQEKFARSMGRASMGSGVMGLGFTLAALGLMTGAMDYGDKDESDEVKKRRAAGIENGSIILPAVPSIGFPGGRITLPKSPITAVLVAGATTYEQMMMSKQSAPLAILNGVREGFADMASEQPYIRSTYDLWKTASRGNIGQFAGNLASGYVPASGMVRSISEVTDKQERSGSGYDPRAKSTAVFDENWWNEQGRGFRNSALKGVPGARNYLVDPSFGGVSEEERGGVMRRIVRQVDPFNFRSFNTYDVPEGKVPNGNVEYLKSPEFKRATTDDLVTIIKYAKEDGEDTTQLEQGLKQKIANARKSRTFTPEEEKNVRDLLGDDALLEEPLRKKAKR